MAGRIDHSAEAVDLLGRADKQGGGEQRDQLQMEALVHATLAVAEQQRTANLIALVARNDAEQRRTGTAGRMEGVAVSQAEVSERNEIIFARVREALGL